MRLLRCESTLECLYGEEKTGKKIEINNKKKTSYAQLEFCIEAGGKTDTKKEEVFQFY